MAQLMGCYYLAAATAFPSLYPFIISLLLLSPGSTFLDRRVFGCANRHRYYKHTIFLLPRNVSNPI
jgi:hypothetical protein